MPIPEKTPSSWGCSTVIDYIKKKTMNNSVYLKGEIRENKELGSLYHCLKIFLPHSIDPITPGQFAMLSIEGNKDILLPRPFSIHRFARKEGASYLDFLFKIIGKGTALLAKLSINSSIRVLAPLGKGFPDPPSAYKALIIAGGMGIAPLFPLILRLKAFSPSVSVLYGAKSRDDLVCLPELLDMGDITIKTTTEDGTEGETGFITKLLKQEEKETTAKTVIYACGPEPMLKKVTNFAAERKMSCWLSLERRMACGVGACLSCVAKTKAGYKSSCKDGPIFASQDIMWTDNAGP
jgi:dihydroorotate dehydrogenase electron transfer subunit